MAGVGVSVISALSCALMASLRRSVFCLPLFSSIQLYSLMEYSFLTFTLVIGSFGSGLRYIEAGFSGFMPFWVVGTSFSGSLAIKVLLPGALLGFFNYSGSSGY